MTSLEYDPAYSAGVRNLLIETATTRRPARRRRIWIGLSLVAGLSVLGAGGAVAVNSLLPGADTVTATGPAHTVNGVGLSTVDVGPAPAGTNSLETTLTCLSTGTLTWPDGAKTSCATEADLGAPTRYSLPWTAADTTFRLTATPGTRWRLTYTFSHRRPTALATNAAGQTYGIDSPNGHPDLIAATATNGRDGYISAKDVAAVDCSNVSSPSEALQCNRNHRRGTTVPVYLSDGTTKIGVFPIGG